MDGQTNGQTFVQPKYIIGIDGQTRDKRRSHWAKFEQTARFWGENTVMSPLIAAPLIIAAP